MPKSVVIVESVAKTKTIKKFLGKQFEVVSSVGHIKDLPKRKLGVDIDDGYEPQYITIRGKGKVLNGLKKAAQSANKVFIATDPDREGEAIAWHIYEEVKSKNQNIHRILFNEITEKAVLDAIEKPLSISINKVEAQKARRVLDRIVGYKISPILWQTIYRGLSAGRVQSVALRLIVEREREIKKFVPEEYWSITAELKGEKTDSFFAKLLKIQNKKPTIKNEKSAQEIVDDLKLKKYQIKNITKKRVSRSPAPPFTTSTMQQEASKRLRFSSKRIMMIAQQLYEGIELGSEGSVGLITYMRTDSTRIANEAISSVRDYIASSYGLEYLPKKPRFFRVKKGAQDAHEAIRPTSMKREPKKIKKYLTKDQQKLYELIWNRFIACQMSDAKMDRTTVDVKAGEMKNNQVEEAYLFRTTGSIITFRGFLQIYEDYKDKDENNGNGDDPLKTKIPTNLTKNMLLKLLDLIPKQHFTKPPARYSESSLVKELDALGIGRPSTYAIIISTLLTRKYIERLNRTLHPTELGFTVNDILINNFPSIFNTKFTAKMEDELDKIEANDKDYLSVIKDFYQPFEQALTKTKSKKDLIRDSLIKDADEKCPECGKELIIRWGRNGKFIGCSGYPDCRYTRPLEEEEVKTDQVCEKCGKPMVVKTGRYGRFLACSGYPECKNNKPYTIGIACPRDDCKGQIVERRTKRGKTFYGCSEYPKCDFATWYEPVALKCENCGSNYLEKRYNKTVGNYLYCPKCKSKYEQKVKEE